jgi:hypothetical protein
MNIKAYPAAAYRPGGNDIPITIVLKITTSDTMACDADDVAEHADDNPAVVQIIPEAGHSF